jgi:ABC-2 type transport system permease protein
MAVYKRTYKAYRGVTTSAWSRFLVVARYSFSAFFDSRPFTIFVALSGVPFLLAVVLIYFFHSTTARLVLNISFPSNFQIDNMWFQIYLQVQAWLGFLMIAWGAPGLVVHDFANNALPLYLSRPLSRAEYLLGKITVLAIVLSCTTWVSSLLLFGLQAEMDGHGWGWQNVWMIGSILIGSWLWIALMSLLAMAVSVWMRWRIAATALLLALLFVTPGFGEAINAVLGTKWGRILNLPYVVQVIWVHLFRTQDSLINRRLDLIPLWAAWACVASVCAISLLLLNRRLRAREVVRG